MPDLQRLLKKSKPAAAKIPVRIYEYAACSTCKNALKFLNRQEIPYEKLPIVEQPPSKSELKRMLRIHGGDLKKLFNASGQVYREMGLSEKIAKLSSEEAIDLLSKNGKLIKRPFLLSMGDDELGFVGFKEADWLRLVSY